jgi:hypothetical protein
MGAQKGLLRGDKFNGKHSTVIDSAIIAIEAARDCDHVNKISIGVISPTKTGNTHLKFTITNTALKMQVRGTNAVQLFWLYTTNTEATIKEIQDIWNARK